MTLTLLGVWLGALGACDLGRAAADLPGRARRLGCLGTGVAVLLIGLLVLRPAAGWTVLILLLLVPCLAAWLLTSTAATDPRGAPSRRARSGAAAFAALGAGTLVAVVGAQVLTRTLDWPSHLDQTFPARWPASAVLVSVGVLLAQLSTANVVVRLVLDAVGVPATTNEKQLKGGRVLGPMERVFIVVLGALGELTAVAIVVAAKGLLRFPELQRAQRAPGEQDGPSDVTEYFLIGSFASWLLALGGAALVHLAS